MAATHSEEFPEELLFYAKGNVDISTLPIVRTKEIRIYLSCTHSDMLVEQTALMERVYPALRDYCFNTYGLEFHVIDLRWGLLKEMEDDDDHQQLYQVEQDQCLQLSEGPNFVILVGQKYGDRPLPASIPATEFELLIKALKHYKSRDTRHAHILDFWYFLDNNALPPMYFLQPRSHIKDQDKILHLHSKDGHRLILTWEETREFMSRLFQRAAHLCFKDGTMSKTPVAQYSFSVLEQEGRTAIQENLQPFKNCIMLSRNIVDLENYVAYPQAAKFINVICNKVDGKCQVDEKAKACLDIFKNSTLRGNLSRRENVGTFEVLWKFEDGVDAVQHANYVDELCSVFRSKIKILIDRQAVDLMHAHMQAPLPPLQLEMVAHWQETKLVLEGGFIGRTKVLNVLKQYITSNDTKLLAITGPSGSGKTAMLCKVATEAEHWLKEDCVIVIRHLGLSHASCDIHQVLHSICMQLAALYGHSKFQLPTSMCDLQNYFLQLLKEWPSTQTLIILLDSIHMLMPQFHAYLLLWLPTELKENVKLVLTTLPVKHGVLRKLRLQVLKDDDHIIDLPPLSAPEALELLLLLLEKRGTLHRSRCRTLSRAQQEVALQQFGTCAWPLYVKLLCEDAARWRHTDVFPPKSLPRTITAYMNHFFEHLEREHGKVLVSHALSYMTASMTGLSDAEMEDILSLDEAVMDEVLLTTNLTLRRLPPYKWLQLKDHLRSFLVCRFCEGFSVYFWAHCQFIDLVFNRYLHKDETKKEIHSMLADYFLGTWSGKMKPYQYVQPDVDNKDSEAEDSESETQFVQGVADRLVPAQRLTFTTSNGTVTYNRRKYDQVPRHLFLSGRMQELNQQVLFNYLWIYNKTKALSFQHMLADFLLNPGVESTLVGRALSEAQEFLEDDVSTMGVELSGRLLIYYHTHPNIRQLIQQADVSGLQHCGLLPNFPYYQVPGSPLKYTLRCLSPPTSFKLGGVNQRFLLIKTSTNPVVQIYDLANGEHVQDIETSVGDMHITPNGSRLVIIDSNSDRSIKIHSSETGRFIGQLIPLKHIKKKPKEKYCMGPVSLTDTHVAFIVTTDKSYLCVADVESCTFLQMQGLEGQASLCQLTSDSQYVFAISRSNIQSFDLFTSEEICNIELEYMPLQLLITEGGHRAFLANEKENKVYAMYLKDGNIEFIYKVVVSEYMRNDTVTHLALSRNQVQLLVRGLSNLVVYNTAIERVTAHFQRPSDVPLEFRLPNSPYTDIHFTQAEFSPDDKLVVATIFRRIYIWNISSNQLLTSLQAPVGIIETLLIPSGRGQLVTQQRNSADIHVWGLGDAIGNVGKLDRLTNSVEEMKISQDDSMAFIRCKGSDEIGVLDMHKGQLVDLLTHNGKVISLSLTRDGMYALVSTEPLKSNTANKIWYLEGRKVIYEFGNVAAHCVSLQRENCLIAIGQEHRTFKAPYHIKMYTFEGDQFEECRLSYDIKFILADPFVTPADKYLVMLTADDYNESEAVHINSTICAISLKANMAVSTFSVKDLCNTVSMQCILSIRPYGCNSYSIIVFYTNEPAVHCEKDGSHSRTYNHCFGFMIFDICSGVVCQVIEDLVAPQTPISHLIFTDDVSLCIDPESNIFHMGNGFFLKRLTSIAMRPRCLALSGRVVVYAQGSCLLALRLSDGVQVGRINVHAEVTTVEVCHDDRTLLLGCADGALLSYVLIDSGLEDVERVLTRLPSRLESGLDEAASRVDRTWDKVEADVMPPYSRPPSVASISASDKRQLQSLKHLPRSPSNSDALLYANNRSKACSVM